jgi:hypothetical protein
VFYFFLLNPTSRAQKKNPLSIRCIRANPCSISSDAAPSDQFLEILQPIRILRFLITPPAMDSREADRNP